MLFVKGNFRLFGCSRGCSVPARADVLVVLVFLVPFEPLGSIVGSIASLVLARRGARRSRCLLKRLQSVQIKVILSPPPRGGLQIMR
jgi:hypothetical protein